MIAKLKGLVDGLGDDWAVIDVNGVGYQVFCSARTLSRLREGQAAALLIDTHVREDHIHLYGFLEAAERDWFRLLTTVQGVGAKVALAVLGVLGGDELMGAVAAGDKAAVSRAPGVGPKLAGRILSELKDKVGTLALGPRVIEGGKSSAAACAEGAEVRDAVSALVNLGYAATDALAAVSRAGAKLGAEPRVEDLIRAALSELAPMEHRA